MAFNVFVSFFTLSIQQGSTFIKIKNKLETFDYFIVHALALSNNTKCKHVKAYYIGSLAIKGQINLQQMLTGEI